MKDYTGKLHSKQVIHNLLTSFTTLFTICTYMHHIIEELDKPSCSLQLFKRLIYLSHHLPIVAPNHVILELIC